jgi:hypothetical protein
VRLLLWQLLMGSGIFTARQSDGRFLAYRTQRVGTFCRRNEAPPNKKLLGDRPLRLTTPHNGDDTKLVALTNTPAKVL